MSAITNRQKEASGYRFKRLRTWHVLRDMRFSRKAVRPGEAFPDFELITPDGETLRSSDLVGKRPLVIVTGSLTCPMTVSSLPELKRLHEELGEEVAFVLLYTREAHPGEHYPQPEAIDDKVEHARAIREIYGVDWQVAVDDLDGTLHRRLDSKPNAAYVIDESGTVVYRALWAGASTDLNDAIRRVARGERPRRAQVNAFVGPLIKALGYIGETIDRAGRKAWQDLIIAVPPMALVGWLAGLRLRPAQKRGKAVPVA